jgi:tetratricopeptide (TPR) repeat protein
MRNSGISKSLVILAALSCSLSIYAGPADAMLDSANIYYMNNNFEKAAGLYLSVINAGFESPELYYNLGNSYYKLDRIAMAVLYYEKALKLDPYDDDIKNNLEMAYSRTADKIETIPDFILKKWWKAAYNLFLPDSWAILSLSLLAVSLFFFFVKRAGLNFLPRKLLVPSGVVLILLAILCFTFSQLRKEFIISGNTAIITDLSVGVKSSPDIQGTNVFVIHEGTKVTILDSLETWKEIRIGNGNVGWVQGMSITKI